MKTMHNLRWFNNRQGKRIFRDDSGCECFECKRIVEEGIIILDEQHAEYLYDTQNEFGAEGIDLGYRDKK